MVDAGQGGDLADLLRDRERQVRESEELLRVGRKLSSVLESLPVGVLIADVEGRICQATEVVSRLLRAEEPMREDSWGQVIGWWDGSTIQPATLLGWWDGSAIQPLG